MTTRFIFSICICTLFSNVLFAQKTVNTNDDYCYAKLKASDQYDKVEEKVLIQAASTKMIKTPAVYDTRIDKILVKPESRKMVYVPAVYKTVTEQVVDRPESRKMITVPAVVEQRKEKVLIKEAGKRMVPVPAVYETVEKQILVSPEKKVFNSVPAVFETKTEKVLAKAASVRFVPVPAQYETVMETVEIEPATVRYETLTPKYKTVTEKVMTKPSYTKWVESKSSETCLSVDPKDCQVWCLVEYPAEYNVVSKKVNIGCDGSGVANSGCKKEIPVPAKYAKKSKKELRSPATTREEVIPEEYTTVTRSVIKTPAKTVETIIPAVYKTVKQRVIKTPATVREEIIPAVYDEITVNVVVTPARVEEQIIPETYKTITKRVVETPATTNEVVIPAEYQNVSKKVLVSAESITMEEIPAKYKTVYKNVLREKGDTQWKRIVCPKFQTKELNGLVQEALRKAGFNPGPSDKIFGPKTYAAMVAFQKANNLWFGHLDYSTMAALNVPLPAEALLTPNDDSRFADFAKSNDEIILSSRGGGEGMGSNSNSTGGNASTNAAGSEANSGASTDISDNSDDEKSDEATTMSSEELQMIDEINLVRKDPKGYVKRVEDYINQVQNDPGLDAAYKADEISSAKELISELKNMSPMQTLKPHEGLHRVGIKHGKDVKGQGMIGHRGSDGTMPWDRVKRDTELKDGNENLVAGGQSVRESLMILLVDSGIPGRGHRKTLLEPKWNHVGVNKIGEVGGIPNAWIQVFGTDK